ncbi:MAG: menaquinone biosynthesis decarboxylase [Planctomycetaceae bacterium]|nr:menaquinone biosynthesis decarboxylase [Planctomycetaceae bacterium]
MPYDHLSEFLNELQDRGELIRISAEVDPALEITEITDRVSKSPAGGPALFFERVKGSTMPVLTNLLGSSARVCRAMGVTSFDEAADRIAGLIRPQAPEGWLEKLKMVPQFAQTAKFPPRVVRNGPCQQVVKLGRDVDLSELPILQCWPLDAGKFITFGQVVTKHPVKGELSVGMHRVQVCDKNSAFMHWHLHHAGYRNFTEYHKLGQQMPIAVSLGGDPVFACMARVPRPPGLDEYQLGGFLRGQCIDLVKCRSIDLEVPASAEIVIEGTIDPTEPWEAAGPFGDRTGFYNLARQFPRLHITAVTHRANPIYPATIFGKPPMEDYWLGKAAERIFLPMLKLLAPEVVDYNMPRAGAFHNLAFVSIKKQYPQQARKVMNAIWSAAPTLCTKIVVVVDEHVDVQNEEQVWFHVGANVHPGRDVVLSEGPTDILDHAAPTCGIGHKLGIDATRKFPEEGHPRPWPEETTMSREVKDFVTQRWAEYGLGNLLPETW